LADLREGTSGPQRPSRKWGFFRFRMGREVYPTGGLGRLEGRHVRTAKDPHESGGFFVSGWGEKFIPQEALADLREGPSGPQKSPFFRGFFR